MEEGIYEGKISLDPFMKATISPKWGSLHSLYAFYFLFTYLINLFWQYWDLNSGPYAS
jgi:hypothetical protein